MSVEEGARSDEEVGRVNVESEGGLRSDGKALGPDGRVGPPPTIDFEMRPLALGGAPWLPSALTAASKEGPRARVKMGSGTACINL